MKRSILIIFLLLTTIFLFRDKTSRITVTENYPDPYVHPLKFFDENLFFKGIASVRGKDYGAEKKIIGGILPHDLLPSSMLADYIQRLVVQKPETIILIGPNHYERGSTNIITSLAPWQTKFGLVNTNSEIVSALATKESVSLDNEILSADHSIASIMSYLKYYLPEVKVVPLIVSYRLSLAEIEKFSGDLAPLVDENTVVLVMVDFSHYLNSSAAQEKDAETLKLISNLDYGSILKLSSANLDSPPSIVLLSILMKELEFSDFSVLNHTNSGEIQRDTSIQTTSYFSIAYYKR